MVGFIVGLCYFFTFAGAAGGALVVLATIGAAKSAPQEASGYALALCLAVIPYVFARTVEKLASDKVRQVVIVDRTPPISS